MRCQSAPDAPNQTIHMNITYLGNCDAPLSQFLLYTEEKEAIKA